MRRLSALPGRRTALGGFWRACVFFLLRFGKLRAAQMLGLATCECVHDRDGGKRHKRGSWDGMGNDSPPLGCSSCCCCCAACWEPWAGPVCDGYRRAGFENGGDANLGEARLQAQGLQVVWRAVGWTGGGGGGEPPPRSLFAGRCWLPLGLPLSTTRSTHGTHSLSH